MFLGANNLVVKISDTNFIVLFLTIIKKVSCDNHLQRRFFFSFK